jgi:hypothetical protein
MIFLGFLVLFDREANVIEIVGQLSISASR